MNYEEDEKLKIIESLACRIAILKGEASEFLNDNALTNDILMQEVAKLSTERASLETDYMKIAYTGERSDRIAISLKELVEKIEELRKRLI